MTSPTPEEIASAIAKLNFAREVAYELLPDMPDMAKSVLRDVAIHPQVAHVLRSLSPAREEG